MPFIERLLQLIEKEMDSNKKNYEKIGIHIFTACAVLSDGDILLSKTEINKWIEILKRCSICQIRLKTLTIEMMNETLGVLSQQKQEIEEEEQIHLIKEHVYGNY